MTRGHLIAGEREWRSSRASDWVIRHADRTESQPFGWMAVWVLVVLAVVFFSWGAEAVLAWWEVLA